MGKRLKFHFHWPFLWVTLALVVIGIFNLHSATYSLIHGGIASLVWSQIIWLAIGVGVGGLLLFVDYRIFIWLSYPLYGVALLLLLLVLFYGKTVAGNRSWLSLGPVTFQPSEFAKLAMAAALARYLSDHPPHKQAYGFFELIRPLFIAGAPLLLIVLGKDMGSALFFLLASASILLFSRIQRRVLFAFLVLLMVGGAVSYKFLLSGHQRSRIEAFLNPEEDPRGKGYHLLQSKITVGSGRLFGKGYLRGMHSKLLYLPEKHTDFIFPVLAEEWGFFGSVAVVGLYLLLLIFGIQIASKARERFGIFLGLGIVAIFFWQVAINLGGVLGLIPLTGVTLPLLSYGGSSMVTILIGISLLLNISMRRFMF